MGWVDYDLGCSTIWSTCSATSANIPSTKAECGRPKEHKSKSTPPRFPNPGNLVVLGRDESPYKGGKIVKFQITAGSHNSTEQRPWLRAAAAAAPARGLGGRRLLLPLLHLGRLHLGQLVVVRLGPEEVAVVQLLGQVGAVLVDLAELGINSIEIVKKKNLKMITKF